MKSSLKAVILLSDEFFSENSGKFFIMTKSQDKLQNTFSILRQKGGNSHNPSVSSLNNILKKVMTAKILQSSFSGNCTNFQNEDECEDPVLQNFICNDICSDSVDNEVVKDIDFDSDELSNYFLEDVFENSSIINLELTSIRYFIGYALHKMLPKLGCSQCLQDLRKEDEVLTAPSELFIFHKNYQTITDFGNLVAPSNSFMEISKKHILVFHNIFQSRPHCVGLKHSILEICKNNTPEWFEGDCSDHREQVLNFIILVLIRKHCFWAVPKGTGKKRKLEILNG